MVTSEEETPFTVTNTLGTDVIATGHLLDKLSRTIIETVGHLSQLLHCRGASTQTPRKPTDSMIQTAKQQQTCHEQFPMRLGLTRLIFKGQEAIGRSLGSGLIAAWSSCLGFDTHLLEL